MKKFTVVILAALAAIFFADRSFAQDNLAPLYLFTSDGGSITPFENGELLKVDDRYRIKADPDFGYTFSGWQEVIVYTFTTIIVDPPDTNTSISVSPVQVYVKAPVLKFTMQPQQILSENAGTILTESVGWQANFTPKPQQNRVRLGTNQLNDDGSIRPPVVRGDVNRAVW